MSRRTDVSHIEPTGDLFPALIPDADGYLLPAGQRFIRQLVEWANAAADREAAERAEMESDSD